MTISNHFRSDWLAFFQMRNFSLFDNKSRNQFWTFLLKSSDIDTFQELSQDKMGLEIPNEYGYVILTGTASIFMLAYKVTWTLSYPISKIFQFCFIFFQGIKVGLARKQYNIKYPKLYSEENGGDNMFNCIQVSNFDLKDFFKSITFNIWQRTLWLIWVR